MIIYIYEEIYQKVTMSEKVHNSFIKLKKGIFHVAFMIFFIYNDMLYRHIFIISFIRIY